MSDDISGLGKKSANALNNALSGIGKRFEKLSSGKRINRAQDDAAGLAIVSALDADAALSRVAQRNTGDAVSVLNIADSTVSQVSDISIRQQELAAQAANGTLSDTQRQTLDQEYQALEEEKGRLVGQANFNGTNVFSSTDFQVGNGADPESRISSPDIATNAFQAGGSIATQGAAQAALSTLQQSSDSLNEAKASIGAIVSRLDVAASSARTREQTSLEASSRISDADIASEVAGLTADRIKVQGSTALAAQAGNIQQSIVSKLLS